MPNLDQATALLGAFNDADWPRFSELAGDLVYTEPATGRSLQGAEYLDAVQGWKTAFTDLSGEITNAVGAGDDLVLEVVWTGTHDGPMMMPTGEQIPATGNSISLVAALVHRFDGDHIVATNHYFDLLTVLRGVGAA